MEAEALFALARTATVAQVLERDDFAKRYKAHEPISVLELLYPLLQGYDSVAVESDIELGGTDQTFNLLLARDIQRTYGVAEQAILTMPILPGIDGTEKMSKSLGNQIGVTDSADEMFGKTMRLPDEAMDAWFELLAIARPEDTGPRDAKRALARGVVASFYGEDAGVASEAAFEKVFVAKDIPEEVEELALAGDLVHLPQLIADGFGRSKSDARRLLTSGGVKLDGETVEALDMPAGELAGKVLQVGKRHFRRLVTGS
jgi:tyrosyl-tRNA synthetase